MNTKQNDFPSPLGPEVLSRAARHSKTEGREEFPAQTSFNDLFPEYGKVPSPDNLGDASSEPLTSCGPGRGLPEVETTAVLPVYKDDSAQTEVYGEAVGTAFTPMPLAAEETPSFDDLILPDKDMDLEHLPAAGRPVHGGLKSEIDSSVEATLDLGDKDLLDSPAAEIEEAASVKNENSGTDSSALPGEDSGKTGGWGDQIPNILTIVRIVLVPLFIGFLLAPLWLVSGRLFLVLALITFCVASATDLLDGRLARKWKLVSRFGKIADPIADKALMISAFLILSCFYGLYWWYTAVVILREVAVTLLRMQLLKRDIVVPASQGGKIKTALQTLTVFLWILMLIFASYRASDYLAILALAALVASFVATVLTGLLYYLDARDNGFGKNKTSVMAAKDGEEVRSLGKEETVAQTSAKDNELDRTVAAVSTATENPVD